MDWDQYYEKFYDWTTSTQISRMSSLTSYGASSEVAEVAQEYMDEMAASRLIKKAVAYGVQFTPEEIYDLSGCCNTEAMNVLLDSSKCRFTKEQLEDLYGAVDDEVLGRVAARNKIRLFEDDEDEEIENETGEEEFFDGPGRKFCVSDFRQSQEFLVENTHYLAYFPCPPSPQRGAAVCAPGRREYRHSPPGNTSPRELASLPVGEHDLQLAEHQIPVLTPGMPVFHDAL